VALMDRGIIYDEIDAERARQSRKWGGRHEWGEGDCSSRAVRREVKATVLTEECGEVARAVLDKNDTQLRAELIQVAAVAVAWLEAL
jgi:NTP pyrophosphatase (non-canonical NTP hydrolase)